MPRLICYSRLSNPFENLFQSITFELSPFKILEYYPVSVFTTFWRIILDLNNIANFFLYATPFLSSENDIKNNKNAFLSDNNSPSLTS